jgi:hypothetical protein
VKQGEVSSPLLFDFALEYAILKIRETQVEMKLNGTHNFLAYPDFILLGDNRDTRYFNCC